MDTKKNKRLYVPEEKADSANHLDLSKVVAVRFPNSKPTETISLRMPPPLLDTIKVEVNKCDVP